MRITIAVFGYAFATFAARFAIFIRRFAIFALLFVVLVHPFAAFVYAFAIFALPLAVSVKIFAILIASQDAKSLYLLNKLVTQAVFENGSIVLADSRSDADIQISQHLLDSDPRIRYAH